MGFLGVGDSVLNYCPRPKHFKTLSHSPQANSWTVPKSHTKLLYNMFAVPMRKVKLY